MNKRIKKKKYKKFINSLMNALAEHSKAYRLATINSQKFAQGGILVEQNVDISNSELFSRLRNTDRMEINL